MMAKILVCFLSGLDTGFAGDGLDKSEREQFHAYIKRIRVNIERSLEMNAK